MIRVAQRSTLQSFPYSRARTKADWCYFVLARFATALGGNWVAIVDFCSARKATKYLTLQRWKGGRVV